MQNKWDLECVYNDLSVFLSLASPIMAVNTLKEMPRQEIRCRKLWHERIRLWGGKVYLPREEDMDQILFLSVSKLTWFSCWPRDEMGKGDHTNKGKKTVTISWASSIEENTAETSNSRSNRVLSFQTSVELWNGFSSEINSCSKNRLHKFYEWEHLSMVFGSLFLP